MNQIHRCRMSRTWSRNIFLACFSALWGLSAAPTHADDAKTAYRRFAVIGSQAVQKSALSDLITVELQQAGIELVEREQLNAVVTEQALASALGDDAPAARIRLGILTKADALVLVNEQPDPKTPVAAGENAPSSEAHWRDRRESFRRCVARCVHGRQL